MADRISKKQRSANMAAVKSRGNKTTEQKLAVLLKENKITGWRRHYERLVGTPDFAFPKQKVAVFVDGCFWHGCKHSTLPKTNRVFWENKIKGNKSRDQRTDKTLRSQGWKPLHVCEYELKKKSEVSLQKITKSIYE